MRVTSLWPLALLPFVAGCGCGGGGGPTDGGNEDAAVILTPDGGGFCGDRLAELPEECDDGNRTSGDGCSSTCKTEAPSTCVEGLVDLNDAGVQNGLFLTFTGSTTNKRNEIEPPTGCQDQNGGKGPEVVHRFNLPVKADYLFTTASAATQLDTVLYQLDACMPGKAPDETACNDDIAAESQIYQSQLFVPALEAGPHYVVVDSYDLGSSGLGKYQLDLQIRPVVPSGSPCDGERVRNRCDDGYVCPVDGGTCAIGAPPQLDTLQYLSLSNTVVRLVMGGTDADKDVSDFIVEFLDGTGQVQTLGGRTNFPLAFDAPVVGRSPFTASATLNFAGAGVALPPQVRVRLRDLSNFEGMKKTATLMAMPERAASAACDARKIVDRCAMGTACKPSAPGSETGTCTAGTAPTLSSVRAFTAPDGSRRVSVDGTDPEGDINRLVVVLKDAAGTAVAADVDGDGMAETPSVISFAQFLGTTSFSGISGLRAALFPTGTTITQVGVKLRDATGLDSAEQTVAFAALPEVPADGSCDPKRWDNFCAMTAPRCEVGKCVTAAGSASVACGAAQPLTVGTPLTGALVLGADRWRAPCSDTGGSAASEKVFSFTTTAVTDLKFTTDFPETTLDTVVYLSNACGESLTVTGCADDVDFGSNNFKSTGIVRNVQPGTHFLFVDAWTGGVPGAGTGDFKLLVSELPILNASGAACDPLLLTSRCGDPLRCKPNAGYTAYSCQ